MFFVMFKMMQDTVQKNRDDVHKPPPKIRSTEICKKLDKNCTQHGQCLPWRAHANIPVYGSCYPHVWKLTCPRLPTNISMLFTTSRSLWCSSTFLFRKCWCPAKCLWFSVTSQKTQVAYSVLLQEYNVEVVHHANITNLDEDGLSCNSVLQTKIWLEPCGMEILTERRFQFGTELRTSRCFLALPLRFWYRAWMIRLLDLKLLGIYGKIFPFCIDINREHFLCLSWWWKGLDWTLNSKILLEVWFVILIVVRWDKAYYP